MTLKAQIMDDVKRAMKAKDKDTVGTIRMLTAAIKQVEVDERRELNDGDVLDIVGKMIKQRKDAASQYEQAGRQDLLDKELMEIGILTNYLPKQLTTEEITAIVENTIAETNASGMQDMGKVMGQVKAKVGLKADMGQVGQIVKAALS